MNIADEGGYYNFEQTSAISLKNLKLHQTETNDECDAKILNKQSGFPGKVCRNLGFKKKADQKKNQRADCPTNENKGQKAFFFLETRKEFNQARTETKLAKRSHQKSSALNQSEKPNLFRFEKVRKKPKYIGIADDYTQIGDYG